MDPQIKKIIVINSIVIVSGLIPIVGILIIPLLFIVNLNLARIEYFENKNKELAVTYLIIAFIAPLIGYSLCYSYYGFKL